MFALELLVQQYAVSHPPQPISEFNVLNAGSRITHLIESADGLEHRAANSSAAGPEGCGAKLSGLIFVVTSMVAMGLSSIVYLLSI